MSIEADIIDFIENAATLYTAIGSDSTRICQSMSANPSLTRPYIVFDIISTNEPRAMVDSSGRQSTLVQFRFVASTLAGAISLRDTFRDAWQTYRIGSGSNTIRSATLQEHRPAYGYPQSGEPVGVTAVEADYLIWHSVAQPAG